MFVSGRDFSAEGFWSLMFGTADGRGVRRRVVGSLGDGGVLLLIRSWETGMSIWLDWTLYAARRRRSFIARAFCLLLEE